MNLFTSFIKKNFFLYFLLCLLISFAGFYWAFDFYFIAEDWWELWIIANSKLNYLIFQTDLFANHPVETFRQILLLKLFGFNSYYWQIFSFSSKVLNSLIIAFAVWGMTNSKRAAVYSGLIFAASVGGLESYHWLGRWSSALILALLAIGFYFWAKSFSEKLINKKYIFALIFFLLAIFGEPGRGSIVFALTIIWDVVTTEKYSKKIIIKILLRNSLFILTSLILLLLFWKDHVLNSTSNNYQEWINYMVNNPLEVIKNFLTSLGNFIAGGFVSTYDSSSLSHPNERSFAYGIILVIFTAIFLIRSLTKKTFFSRRILFFSLWIPIAFFPNWFIVHYFYAPPLIAGVTHHYFTISALGFCAILGYFLSKFNKVLGISLLTVVILTNIAQSNRILKQEWDHRSAQIVQMAWDKINKEVPLGIGDNSIFFFVGGDPLASDLDAADAIPFAIKRGITSPVEMPIQTIVGQESLKRFLCEDRVSYMTAVRGYAKSKKKVPLSNLYVWEVKDGIITNISDRERKKILDQLRCNYIL